MFANTAFAHLLIENPDEILLEKDPVTVICPKRKRLSHYEDLFSRRAVGSPHRNAVQKVIVPEGVENLGSRLFKDCTSLEEVELPDSLQTIGEEAFAHCISLRTIKMPNSMKRIGRHAFEGCVDLHSISIPEGIKRFPLFSCPFKGCTNLEHVDLPESFSFWKENIFQGCINLSSISSAWFVAREGAIYTKDLKTLVSYTSGAKHFVVPEGVTTIECVAFIGSEIEEVSFPSSLLTIKELAFCDCRKLLKVVFTGVVKHLHKWAFDSSDTKYVFPYGKEEFFRDLIEHQAHLILFES